MTEEMKQQHRDFHCSNHVRIEPKVWGREEWIINNNSYCGKKLVFNQGYRCSLHYHKVKEETFYLLTGKMLIEIGETQDSLIKRIMLPGDIQHIPIGVVHRMTGLEPSELMEFSTFHQEEDSYRIIVAGRADDVCLTPEL